MLRLLQELSRGKPKLEKVPNLTWKQKKLIKNPLQYVARAEDIDQLNYWDFSVLKNYKYYLKLHIHKDRYGKRSSIFYLINGRGCPFDCSFCGGSKTSQKVIFGRTKYIIQKPENVLTTIVNAQKLGFDAFHFGFDPCCKNSAYYSKLFKLIRREKIETSIIFSSWGLPPRKLINDLHQTFPSVCVEISPTTASEKLRKINGGLFYTNRGLENTLKHMAEKKITALVYFGFFIPFEKTADTLQTINYAMYLKEKYSPYVICSYLPFSSDPASKISLNPSKYQVVYQAKDLNDYIIKIDQYNRQGITDNMLLFHPRGISQRHFMKINHLIQCVWALNYLFPKSNSILKNACGGNYMMVILMIYKWLKGNDFDQYYLTNTQVKSILREMTGTLLPNN